MAGPISEAKARCDADYSLAIGLSCELAAWLLLVWADNLLVLASMAEGLPAKCKAYEQALPKPRPTSFRKLIGGAAQSPRPSATVADSIAGRRTGCLGVRLDHCGSTKTMGAHRLEVATKDWGRWRHLLGAPALAVHTHMHKTYETVVASALWVSPLWAASSCLHGTLTSAEQRWTRCVAGCRTTPDEEWIPYYRRKKAAAAWIQNACAE